jgi:hypothetical protein
MPQVARVLLLLVAAGALLTVVVAIINWWLEPHRRIGRALRAVLDGPVDALATAPLHGQGAALRISDGKIAIVRSFADRGLVFDLDELIGAELIFDGQVAARVFRGEQRVALNNIAPQARRVTLRLVFDDLRDPEFLLELWSEHNGPPDDPAAEHAMASARAWFARAEAVVRRG